MAIRGINLQESNQQQ